MGQLGVSLNLILLFLQSILRILDISNKAIKGKKERKEKISG